MQSALEQRKALQRLSGLSRDEMDRVFRAVMTLPQTEQREALIVAVRAVSEKYGDAAAALAAEWYEDARQAAMARGTFTPLLADHPDGARWVSLIDWANAPLSSGDAPTPDAVLGRIVGGMDRSVRNLHRQTIMRSSVADSQAVGWRRLGAGACGFCRMLIGRGAVYAEETATFGSHDHCNCQAAPDFKNGEPIDVRAYQKSARRIDGIDGEATGSTKADQERAQAWIAANL